MASSYYPIEDVTKNMELNEEISAKMKMILKHTEEIRDSLIEQEILLAELIAIEGANAGLIEIKPEDLAGILKTSLEKNGVKVELNLSPHKIFEHYRQIFSFPNRLPSSLFFPLLKIFLRLPEASYDFSRTLI